MYREYSVFWKGNTVGTVRLEQQGLYWQLRCRCCLPEAEPYRLVAETQNRTESMGILVPEGGQFCLDTRVSTKRLGTEPLHFRVTDAQAKQGQFVPVIPEEPVSCIDRLGQARLVHRDGVCGLLLPEETATETAQVPPGSDQSRAHSDRPVYP